LRIIRYLLFNAICVFSGTFNDLNFYGVLTNIDGRSATIDEITLAKHTKYGLLFPTANAIIEDSMSISNSEFNFCLLNYEDARSRINNLKVNNGLTINNDASFYTLNNIDVMGDITIGQCSDIKMSNISGDNDCSFDAYSIRVAANNISIENDLTIDSQSKDCRISADVFGTYSSSSVDNYEDISVIPPNPTPPVGADVFYWYGQYNTNWSIKSDFSAVHALIKNADNLELVRNASGGGIATWTIQTDMVYSGGIGKTLYLKYEVTDLSTGSINEIDVALTETAGTGYTTSGQIFISNPTVNGIQDVTSGSTTGTTSGYATAVRIRSSSALYSVKIYEIYYL
jgi:hypothetical protein